MTTKTILTGVALSLLTALTAVAAEPAQESTLSPAKTEDAVKYPSIVLYSVSWCPHCLEAKEYLTKNDIPFINRDVEVDSRAMEELTGKYKSTGVPVLVFGSGEKEVIMKGFTPDLFRESLKKAQSVK